MSGQRRRVRTVLFDLDGTLLDTAPDLGGALNRLLHERGRPALPLERIRPYVSGGARRLVQLGFGVTDDAPEFPVLRRRFLELYHENLAAGTRLFPGMDRVLQRLESRDRPWGIVTNKPGWLTTPLLAALGLDLRAACVVSGDTTGRSKPHPQPVLYACERLGVAPGQCLLVGDDRRDVEAGRAAGTMTVAALFGYIPTEEDPADWGADGGVRAPVELLDWIPA